MEIQFSTPAGLCIWDGLLWCSDTPALGPLMDSLNRIVLPLPPHHEAWTDAAGQFLSSHLTNTRITEVKIRDTTGWPGKPLTLVDGSGTQRLDFSKGGPIIQNHDSGTDQSPPGGALTEAELYLRRSSCPDGPEPESHASGGTDDEDWDRPEREWNALIQWCKSRNLLWDGPGPQREETREHGISFPGDEYCYKFTRPGLTGFTVDWYDDGSPYLLNARPQEYLQRLLWQNLIFEDRIELLGIWRKPGEAWRVVTRQPLVQGHEPTLAEIEKGMSALSFTRLKWVGIGYAAAQPWRVGRMGIWDVHPGNVFMAEGVLVPVDVIITRLPDHFLPCHFHP